MSSYLVVVSDSVFPNLDPAREVLSAIGAELQMAGEPTPDAIVRAATAADALLVTYAKITAEMIRQMSRCRIISRFGIGVDNVDIRAATDAGIVVTKVPDYCIDEVSDHAVALLLSLVRKIPFSSAQVHRGTWAMSAVVPIHRLRGSVLGLVGFGRIPQLVAPKAKAFGVRVVAFDPYVPPEIMTRAGVESVDFPQLLKMSDYISIHSPLLPETRDLFGDEAFRQMKPTAYLINTARGPIVDEKALYQALSTRAIAGAAIDVFEQEPTPADNPLLELDNLVVTPHHVCLTDECINTVAASVFSACRDLANGRVPKNVVNQQVLGRVPYFHA